MEVSEITGVDVGILEGKDPRSASVAVRMFWASKRVTTRVEDIAYCLMGLFGVNMPLLYGEGRKAFIRLQEEIMKISDDHSLFAWRKINSSHNVEDSTCRGLLASSPAYFVQARNIVPTRNYADRTPFATTNQGLCIELVLVSDLISNPRAQFIAVLDCVDTRDYLGPIRILLQHLSPPKGEQFARTSSDRLFTVTPKNRTYKGMTLPAKVIYVRQRPEVMCYPPVYLTLSPTSQSPTSFSLCGVHPIESWTSEI